MSIYIKKIGTYSNEGRKISNHYFSNYLDTNDEWIVTRTGIKNRYFSEISLLEMIKKSIENLNLSSAEIAKIDGIFLATMSSELRTPSLASMLQKEFGLKEDIVCLDINTACSGFIYATITASSYIEYGLCQNVLIIGADKMSDIIDHNDRNTAILFGDGAGAIYCEKSYKSNLKNITLKSRGNDQPLLAKTNDTLKMNGQEVFKFAVKESNNIIKELDNDQISYYLLHQANIRILESVRNKQKISLEKLPHNIEEYGNTSSASIPLLLEEIFFKLTENDQVLFLGFGGGLTWGSFVYQHIKEKNE